MAEQGMWQRWQQGGRVSQARNFFLGLEPSTRQETVNCLSEATALFVRFCGARSLRLRKVHWKSSNKFQFQRDQWSSLSHFDVEPLMSTVLAAIRAM